MPTCASCGAQTGANRFCAQCGTPVAAPPAIAATEADETREGLTRTAPMTDRARVWTEAELDKQVAKAAGKKDVERLVHLAKYGPNGRVREQAAQVLAALASELGAAHKVGKLVYILVNLEDCAELTAAFHAAVDALACAGPEGIREVVNRAQTVTSMLYGAEALRRVGDEVSAQRLAADAEALLEHESKATERTVALGRTKYLGGCPGFGPARDGTLKLTTTRVLLDSTKLLDMSAVASIEIGGGQVAKSRLAATLAFGAVGALAAKSTQDRAELVIHLVSGEAAFFFVEKKSAAEVRAVVSPILRSAGIPFKDEADHQAMVAAANPGNAASASLVSDLARLADLHKLGVLTDAELAAAKSKLLG
jgi:hypothetical protein